MEKKRLIIFDLDGTIVDAYKAIEKSLNFTLESLGYPAVDTSSVRRAVGWGDKNFIIRFVKTKDVNKALKIYRSHHKISLLKYSRLIQGARRILGFLKKQDYKLAIASNRPRRFTNIIVRHLGLQQYFDVVVCAKNKDDIKPNPNLLLRIIKKLKVKKEHVFYVGDMAIDVSAGKNAGIDTVAVLGGSSTKSQLKNKRPFKIISRLSDLIKIVNF